MPSCRHFTALTVFALALAAAGCAGRSGRAVLEPPVAVGRFVGRASHESVDITLWRGSVEVDVSDLDSDRLADLQSTACRRGVAWRTDEFEVAAVAAGTYTYWAYAYDPSDPPRSPEEYAAKGRSAVGRFTVTPATGTPIVSVILPPRG